MADPSPFRDGDDPTGPGAHDASPPGTPRWVKVFAIIAVAVILLLVIGLLLGGGRHGPGRHMSLGEIRDPTSGSPLTANDAAQL